MIEDPDTRPRMTEKRMLCATLTVLFLLLFVGLLVGLVTWYRAEADSQAALMAARQRWQTQLYQLQHGRQMSDQRLMEMASRIGCLFKEGSPYHQAALQGLADANARLAVGRSLLQEAAPSTNGTQRALLLTNVSLTSADVSETEGSLAAVQELYESGVRLFIGFPDSDDLFRVVRWAGAHAPDAVFVSPSATAFDLDTGSGSALLLSMGDSALAVALVCLLKERGVRHLVPVVADTTYGRSLLEEVRRAALYDGAWMKVLEPVLYRPPAVAERATRRAVLRSARDALAALGGRRGAAGLLFVAGTEMRQFLEDGGWDRQLAAAQWFGADAVALRGDVLATEAARAAAVRVRLTALMYAGAEPGRAPEQWAVLRRLRGADDQPAPNVLRAYDGAALLAELGHLLLGRGGTAAALAALRAAARPGVTGAAAVDDGSRRAGGSFAVARVVARADRGRRLLTAAGEDALWAVTGQVRIAADPQQGMYLGRAVLSTAGSAFHLLRPADVRALYAAVGGCGGDSLQLIAAEPTAYRSVSAAYRADELPQRLLVPAAQPVRLELHCGRSDSGLMHLTVRCPGVQLPGADTVFCLAETYRLVGGNESEVAAEGVRWRHGRHLVSCGAASAECLDRPCHEQRSCVKAMADELAGWYGHGGEL